jgi:hypothetical protein
MRTFSVLFDYVSYVMGFQQVGAGRANFSPR